MISGRAFPDPKNKEAIREDPPPMLPGPTPLVQRPCHPGPTPPSATTMPPVTAPYIRDLARSLQGVGHS